MGEWATFAAEDGMKVVVVSDAARCGERVADGLTAAGLRVTCCAWREAVARARAIAPEACVVVSLLGGDLAPSLTALRDACPTLPILVVVVDTLLPAYVADARVVAALDAGADMAEVGVPSVAELVARLRSLVARYQVLRRVEVPPPVLVAGAARVDVARHRAWIGAVPLVLSPMQWRLWVVLVRHADGLAPWHALIPRQYRHATRAEAVNLVRAHIRYVRFKLGEGLLPHGKAGESYGDSAIESILGEGYRLVTSRLDPARVGCQPHPYARYRSATGPTVGVDAPEYPAGRSAPLGAA